jgi:hypothetical protein
MLLGHPAELPQRFLEPLGERGEALAAADRPGVLPTAEDQPEVVEPVAGGRARDGDAQRATVGEVRQRLPTGRMLLAEDRVTVRSLRRAPVGDAALQRAQQAVRVAPRVEALELLQQRDRPQLRHPLQERHERGVPDALERVPARAVARGLALRLGSAGSFSIRRPVRSLSPAFAAAAPCVWLSLRKVMYSLTCWSVIVLPGIRLPLRSQEDAETAAETGQPNRRHAVIVIVVAHRASRWRRKWTRSPSQWPNCERLLAADGRQWIGAFAQIIGSRRPLRALRPQRALARQR